MRIDTNLLGAVAMPDAGLDGPPATERRYGRADFAAAYEDFVALAEAGDRLGYDTMWWTEHHFQHEGYEVVGNQILLGLWCAARTPRMRYGQMFNIVPQWNPLRLAEDFATADLLTGGRMRFGVGRGTVPREMETLGASIESNDNDMDTGAEQRNREVFAEAMEVIRTAWANDRFAYSGKHFTLPPPGIPDRGGVVTDLTLVPNVTRPVEIHQACTSPATVKYVAEHGHTGVYAWQSPDTMARRWAEHAAHAEAAGRTLAPGEERMLVLHVCVGRTREEAMAAARPNHEEVVKLLAPYGRYNSYDLPEGWTSKPHDFAPTLEESVRQRIWAVGTADDVAEVIDEYRTKLGMTTISVAVDGPGTTRDSVEEQLTLVAEEVAPRLGVAMTGPRAAAA
ncbi:LLM class flavin-dependent oxidoreductase [Klenkia taihuensis]|uniref:Flavin-dependent oxidoreductase, luciferase family (Includes alkanesulfonate monooxygenase SsuD and methylene tetrahydromethanopterin reductase) n=1 Tax=Klenkia taihuensis TaxID=1225127 RepID=A0A1I1QTA5_9ACTN|nr:LLM class flavin-dependent oxidoreductase [Klenkia taihuensis]GHE07495.1 hypothetical protein GCM10011381_04180 [Klenkia taihuensis]SFD25255.1 Flavin-dependent oxidoreductase, luciferase family (includes alkanesulfonate monooxygenase SsuD and methylene tetrahydromethanopterin reductase) [Klenkia taihuensis]